MIAERRRPRRLNTRRLGARAAGRRVLSRRDGGVPLHQAFGFMTVTVTVFTCVTFWSSMTSTVMV